MCKVLLFHFMLHLHLDSSLMLDRISQNFRHKFKRFSQAALLFFPSSFSTSSTSPSVLRACEELVRTLGFDWLLMFMEEHLHSSTVTAALWILVVLLSNQSILNRFKEGLCGGGWLDHTDSVLTNKIGTVLGKKRWQIARPTRSPPTHSAYPLT